MSCCILVRDYRLPIGGVETWVETLAEKLPSRGVRTVVIVPCDSPMTEARARASLPCAEVCLIEARQDCVSQAKVILEALSELGAQRGVFFTGYYEYNNIVGINLLGSRIIVIPVMHGRSESSFPWIIAGPPEAVVSPSSDFGYRCYEHLRRSVGKLRSRSIVETIPHGVCLPQHELVEAKLQRQITDPLRVSAVSRLNNDLKRPWDYVAIASAIRDRNLPIQILLAGDGPEFSAIESFCRGHHIEGQLQLRGRLSASDVATQNLSCDCFLSTSESEAFGLSIFEAAAAGCAIVTAAIPGPVEQLVTQGAAVNIPVGDIPAFVAKLERMRLDGVHLREMGKRGSEFVRENFNVELMADRYAKLIGRVSARGFRPFKPRFLQEFVETPEQRAQLLAIKNSRFRRFASIVARRLRSW